MNMENKLIAILTALLLCTTSASAEGDPKLQFALPQVPRLFANDRPRCPTSNSDWEQWRDESIAALMSRTQTEGGERFLSYEGLIREADRINQFIVACRSQREYRDADRADAIIGNLNRFTKALRLNNYSDHRFGFAITDREFLESVRPQIAIPELLQSQEFLRKVSAPNNYAAANAMIEDHNRTLSPERRWIVLLYKSRFLPTPDRAATFGRFFVFVRDGVYDKWIQFGIRTPDQPGQEENQQCIDRLRWTTGCRQ